MKKPILIAAALLGVSGVAFSGYQFYVNKQESKNITINEVKVPQHETVLSGVLIPVNDERVQKLLLVDLAVYSRDTDAIEVEQSKNRIKNMLLQTFSTKQKSYFYKTDFVANLQTDITQAIQGMPDSKVNEVLVTKAIFQ